MRIAKSCASVSFMFSPPLFLGRNNVFLAIGSGVLLCHKYWKMFLCIFFIIFSGIRKTLLKNVFIRIGFPYNESCLVDIFCMSFSIFVRVFFQLSKFLLNLLRKICQGFWYIGAVAVLLRFVRVFVFQRFGLYLLVKLGFFLSLWLNLLLY